MDIHSQETDMYESTFPDAINNQDKIVRMQLEQYLRPYILIIGMLCALLALEIYRWYTQSPPLPGVFIGLLLVALTYAVYRIHEYKDHFNFLRLGRKGEPNLSNALTKFSNDTGSTIYKDVNFGKAKIEYLILNGTGVFIINVINWYAPANNEAVIHYSDDEILLNGYRPDANPLVIQKHLTGWLEGILNKEIKTPILVHPIIVFPGWFVKTPNESTSIKVMNPRELNGYLEDKTSILSDNDITLLNYQISKLIKK